MTLLLKILSYALILTLRLLKKNEIIVIENNLFQNKNLNILRFYDAERTILMRMQSRLQTG